MRSMTGEKWAEMVGKVRRRDLSYSTRHPLRVDAHKQAYISHVEKPNACRVLVLYSRKGELQTCATHDETGFLEFHSITC